MSEKAWQRMVIQLAHLHGFAAAHFRPAMTGKGWRTPVQGDGEGFPDTVLARVRPPWRVIVVECKTDTGRLTAKQREWLDILRAAGLEVYVWRPMDLKDVQQVLSREERP